MDLGVLVWSRPWMESGNAAINSFDDEVEPELMALWCSPVCVSATAKLGIDIAHPWPNQCLALSVVSKVVAPRCQRGQVYAQGLPWVRSHWLHWGVRSDAREERTHLRMHTLGRASQNSCLFWGKDPDVRHRELRRGRRRDIRRRDIRRRRRDSRLSSTTGRRERRGRRGLRSRTGEPVLGARNARGSRLSSTTVRRERRGRPGLRSRTAE